MLTEHSNKNFKECVIEGFTFLYNNIRSATANLEDPEIFVALRCRINRNMVEKQKWYWTVLTRRISETFR